MDIVKKDIGGNAEAEVVLYQPDSSIHIEVLVEGETVWLTQQQMSELFSTTRNNIILHIRNIFKEGELNEDSVCKESLRTAADGKKYRTKFYNLDVIVPYRCPIEGLGYTPACFSQDGAAQGIDSVSREIKAAPDRTRLA